MNSFPSARSARPNSPRPCCWPRSPTRRRRGARSSRSPRVAMAWSRLPLTADMKVVPFSAHTRISGLDLAGRGLRKGAVDAILAQAGLKAEHAPDEFHRAVDVISPLGRHAARRLRQWPAAWRRASQGHRQARHQGALRRAARHGDQDGHGDRRQSDHRGGHRRRGRRRRLHRAGHARGQARNISARSSRAAG